MDPGEAYAELLKLSLLDLLGPETRRAVPTGGGGVQIESVPEEERADRLTGRDWPADGMTMVGRARLDNLHRCVQTVIGEGIPGDFIEAGVWRGGATILMRGLLDLYGDAGRAVWVADSFAGLPPPDAEAYPADAGDRHHLQTFLSVSEEEVRRNFSRYGLLDDRVRFLRGFFRDTLPTLHRQQWAVARIDGDMYESTMLALEHLYPRVSPGGFVIVDDYGAVEGCRLAVEEFRRRNAIEDEMERVDWTAVCWRRSGASL